MSLLQQFQNDKAEAHFHVVMDTLNLMQKVDYQDTDNAFSGAIMNMVTQALRDAQTTIAVQNARIAELEALSHTDDLTKIYNRRGFFAEVEKALARAKRSSETGLLILMDVDGFKRLNDTYGHRCGDRVLMEIANVLNASVRKTDAVGRLGGDEFALMLTNTTLKNAREKIRHIRKALSELIIPWGEDAIQVDISMGMSAYRRTSELHNLYSRADRNLYAHKASQRRLKKTRFEVVH